MRSMHETLDQILPQNFRKKTFIILHSVTSNINNHCDANESENNFYKCVLKSIWGIGFKIKYLIFKQEKGT